MRQSAQIRRNLVGTVHRGPQDGGCARYAGATVTAGRRDLLARTRGAQAPLPVACASHISRPPSSTARSGHGILEPGERIGTNRSATRKALASSDQRPASPHPGTAIVLDSAGKLFLEIGEGNLRAGWTARPSAVTAN